MEFTPPSAKVVFERILRLNRPGIRRNIPIDRTLPSRTTTLRILLVWTAFELSSYSFLSFGVYDNGKWSSHVVYKHQERDQGLS